MQSCTTSDWKLYKNTRVSLSSTSPKFSDLLYFHPKLYFLFFCDCFQLFKLTSKRSCPVMSRPTTASTATSVTDSPPPQSPITPPPYAHRLPPFFKVQIVEDGGSRMEESSPFSLSSLPKHSFPGSQDGGLISVYPDKFLPHNQYTSECQLPKASLDRISSVATPPSGHDLMHLFPFQPSRVTDPDRNIHVGASSSRDGSKPPYINTSIYFVKEEREFFRSGGSVTGRDLELRLEKERGKGLGKGRGNETSKDALELESIRNALPNHTSPQTLVEPPVKRRRKSTNSGKMDYDSRTMAASLPPPPLALGKVRQHVYSTPPSQRSSRSTPSRSPSHSPSFQVRAQPAVCHNTPNAISPAPRRRAGKYTKRVFVHPNPLPNVNPPYLLANVYPPSSNDMNPTINVYPLANPLPLKTSVPYPPNSPPHSFPQPPPSQFIEFAR